MAVEREMNPKINVTDLSYLISAIDESDLDEKSKEKMRHMVHSFSDQHSTLATALATEIKKANKNPVLKMFDRLIPPASERQGGTFDWEEKSVSKSTPKPKAAVKKSKPKKSKPEKNIDENIDEMFSGIDDQVLGFDD